MKYLSIDIESTGLKEYDWMIEFAMIPFCTETRTVEKSLKRHFFIKCPSFKELKADLDIWVIENNYRLICTAHKEGLEKLSFKEQMTEYFMSKDVLNYFDHKKIILFGKSLNAIDLPLMTRYLGYNYMRHHFHHQVLDLSSIVMLLVDRKKLPVGCLSGSFLMEYFKMGKVAHTAMEDAMDAIQIYLKVMEEDKDL